MIRATVTWLDIAICAATGLAVSAYYLLHMPSVEVFGYVIDFVRYGVFIAGIYVALELLSAVVGEGGNSMLFWLSYLASWFVALATAFATGYVYLGTQQNYAPVIEMMNVPYAKQLLLFLLVFSWLSALVGQKHKHWSAWQHAIAARTVLPPAPIPPTIPAAVAPPVPGSAVSVVFLTIFLVLLALIAYNSMFGGIKFNIIGGVRAAMVETDDSKGCRMRAVPIGKNAVGRTEYNTVFDC